MKTAAAYVVAVFLFGAVAANFATGTGALRQRRYNGEGPRKWAGNKPKDERTRT